MSRDAGQPQALAAHAQSAQDDYLLIGSYALAAHDDQSATTVIDVMVPATAQAGHRVKAALMVLPNRAGD